MYNGIGLTTARGSGTNGHVQRNYAFVRMSKKDNLTYKTEEDLAKVDAASNRQPNQEILEHQRKRKIEVKCAEFEEILEDQGYSAEEIAIKVQSFRIKLMEQKKDEIPKNEFGRITARETHQIAAAQQEKNAKLRSAFGLSEYFVEGSSFDPNRKAKEELAKSAALQEELQAQRDAEKEKNKRYNLVRTPSVEIENDVAEKSDSHSKHDKKKDKQREKEKEKAKEKEKEKVKEKDKDKEKEKEREKSKKKKREKSKKKRSRKHRDSSDSDDSSSDSDSGSDTKRRRKKSKKDK